MPTLLAVPPHCARKFQQPPGLHTNRDGRNHVVERRRNFLLRFNAVELLDGPVNRSAQVVRDLLDSGRPRKDEPRPRPALSVCPVGLDTWSSGVSNENIDKILNIDASTHRI